VWRWSVAKAVVGARDSCIDLFTFEHVRVDGADGPRLVDADGAVPGSGVTVVTGPSGSGKSTLLRLCNRLEVADAGRVLHRGDDVMALDPLQLRRRVGMVFQRPTPFPGTVRDNLRVAMTVGDADASALLEQVGLDAGFLDRRADELSAGEAQRMCLARTLVTEPDVLLMDEPTASLDDENVRLVEQLTCDMARSGVAVLWVTHDREQLRRIADAVVVVRAGRMTRIGTDDA